MNDIIKCHFCNRKLNLINQFECKCNYIFCINHKSSFDHNCTFNYKEYERNIIKKNNPVIVAKKINNI